MKLLLLSGGIDSAALAIWEKPQLCLTVDYGQPSFAGELRASQIFAKMIGAEHYVRKMDIYKSPWESNGLWPFRNQLLITTAAAMFGSEARLNIIFGALSTDVYADCTAPFVSAMNSLFELQEKKVRVSAPGIELDETELILRSSFPAQMLGSTYSCHRSDLPCGDCPGCDKQTRVRAKLATGSLVAGA